MHKTTATTTTIRFTAIIQVSLRVRTGWFCWCKVLLPAYPCWQQPAHSDYGRRWWGSPQQFSSIATLSPFRKMTVLILWMWNSWLNEWTKVEIFYQLLHFFSYGKPTGHFAYFSDVCSREAVCSLGQLAQIHVLQCANCEWKCADTIGTVLVPWAGQLQC